MPSCGRCAGSTSRGSSSALRARVAMLQGKRFTFDEESRALYDAVAPTHTEAEFEAVLDAARGEAARRRLADRALRSLQAGLRDSRRAGSIACSRRPSAPAASARWRTSTLPPGERFTVEYVTGKSWSGYNWYQGELPEPDPGEHRPADLHRPRRRPGVPRGLSRAITSTTCCSRSTWCAIAAGWSSRVYPLFSPQSLIAEGTANYGIEVAFSPAERLAFERDVLFPLAGLDADARRGVLRRARAGRPPVLRRQRGGAPLSRTARIDRAGAATWLERYAMYPRPRAEQRVRFIDQYRSYVINYNLGQGPGPGLRREAGRAPADAGAALERVRGAAVVAAPALGIELAPGLHACAASTSPSSALPKSMRVAERPAPVPAPGEVLIDVHAAGVNRPDIIQRYGKYPPPPGASDILGLEVAGTMAARGRRASPGWRAGDAVCALVAGGGYAEQCVAPQEQCLPMPAGLSMIEAAALPETFFTVWTNLFDRGRLARGRVGADPRRHERHRHDGHSAGGGARRAGRDHRRQRREVRGVPAAGRRAGVELSHHRLGGGDARRPPTAAASTSCSTWSAATTPPGTSRCWRVDGRLVQIAFLKSSTGRTRHRAADAEAPVADRLDAASADAGGEGRDRRVSSRRRCGRCWRAAPWRRSSTRCSRSPTRRGAPAHGVQRARGKDRARCPSLSACSPRASR